MEHYYKNIHGWANYPDYLELYSQMVNKFSDGSHFVEIGSWYGRSAVFMGVEILNSKKKIKFDCVDSWDFVDWIYSTDADLNIKKHSAFSEFLKNIKPLSDIINYHKLKSIEASKLYADESLNFVFVDGSHEYEHVKNDLIYWFPKIKHGGVFAGHDYSQGWTIGVINAVNEFFEGKKFEIRYSNTWIYNKL